MTPCRAALILGSARPSGWSQKLGRALAALAPPGLALLPVELSDLPLYHEDLEEPSPPRAWARFRSQILSADALLFVTPEYNRSIPALLKNAIDIGSSPHEASVWGGKPAAVASFSPGMLGGFGAHHHLRQCLASLDVPVLPHPEIYLSQVGRLFDPAGELVPGPARELLISFLKDSLVWFCRLASSGATRVAPTDHIHY